MALKPVAQPSKRRSRSEACTRCVSPLFPSLFIRKLSYRLPVKKPVHALTSLCDGVVFLQHSEVDDFSLLDRFAMVVQGLIGICYPTNNYIDFSEVRQIMHIRGRLAVVVEYSDGEKRSESVWAKALHQLDGFAFQIARTEQVFMILTSSHENPVSVEEELNLTSSLFNRIGTEPPVLKIGNVADSWFDDRLYLTLLLWEPLKDLTTLS